MYRLVPHETTTKVAAKHAKLANLFISFKLNIYYSLLNIHNAKHNESVEFHVLSIEGSDKTRIRRTNGTPHLCMTRVACGMRQKACRCGMG